MTLPSLDAARRSQRPYRYGMILLCVGALVNWLGLAENYVEPVRYIGVACIIAGALLICAAMCCWLQRPATDHPDNISQVSDLDHQIHVIEVPCSLEPSVMQQKPPDYETVADAPPCYEDAIKLSPSLLLANTTVNNSHHDQSQLSTPSTSAPSPTTRPSTCSEIMSSSEAVSMVNSETGSNIHSASSSNSRQNISRLSHVTVDRYGVPGTPPPPYVGTR